MHRSGLVLCVATLIAGCVYATYHHQQWGYDDAYISYRYAANLVDGHGLVFNPGERVEGYSNLLYVLIMAAGLLFIEPESIYGFSVAVNVLCLCGALVALLYVLEEALDASRAVAAGMLFALCPPLWLAAWSGMETCLVLFLFVGAWAEIYRLERGQRSTPSRRLALWLALLVLSRADGFVMAGIIVAYLALHGWWRVAWLAGGAVAATFALQLGLRWSYYGFPLPNTYYVKVSGELRDRIQYAWSRFTGFAELFPYLGAIVVEALGVAKQPFKDRLPVEFGFFFATLWLAYWFYVGGDIFGMRFLLVLLPVGFAAVADLLPEDWHRRETGRATVVAALLFLIAIPAVRAPFESQRTDYDAWTELGHYLREHHPDALIAVDGAGKVPYYSGLRTVDMLGLNDLHIARLPARFHDPGHSKFDSSYVYSREPDLIASRVKDRELNLYYGFRVLEFQRRGYELAYLVHLGPVPRQPAILRVRGFSQEDCLRLVRRGYGYAVLARKQARS